MPAHERAYVERPDAGRRRRPRLGGAAGRSGPAVRGIHGGQASSGGVLRRRARGLRGSRGPGDPARAVRHRRARPHGRHRPRGRERGRVDRARAHRLPHRCLVGRLDGGWRAGAADPGWSDRDRLRDQAQVADRRVRRVRARGRVRDLPHVLDRRPARPAARRAAGGPAGRRELPVRPHRRVARRLLRPRAAAHVGVPEGRLARRGLGGRAPASGVRRLLAHLPRHAPPARPRRGRADRHRRGDGAAVRVPGRRRRRARARPGPGRRRGPPRADPSPCHEGRGRRTRGEDARRRFAGAATRARQSGRRGAALV